MGFIRGARHVLVGLGLGSVLGLVGGQEVLDAAKNREPHVMSCEDFQKGAPDKTWVKLTNCTMNIAAATYFYNEKNNKISDLYIPVFPLIENPPEKTKLSLHSTSSEWIAMFEDVRRLSNDKEKLTAFIAEHHDKFVQNMDIEGTIEYGMNKSSDEHARLSQMDEDLAPGFSVVKHKDKPSMGLGLGMIAAGAISMLVGLWRGLVNLRR